MRSAERFSVVTPILAIIQYMKVEFGGMGDSTHLSRPPPSRPLDIKNTRIRAVAGAAVVVVLVHASHVANASAALNAPEHVTLDACLLAGN